MKRIAVLMTCYNRVETTLRCLRGLAVQKLPEEVALDVWLVDDGSTDGTGEAVKRWWGEKKVGQESRSTVDGSESDLSASEDRRTTDTLHIIHSKGGLFWCKGMRLAWDCAVRGALGDRALPRGGESGRRWNAVPTGDESGARAQRTDRIPVAAREGTRRTEGDESGGLIEAALPESKIHSSTSTLDFDFFLWLNDDVILKPNAIAGLLADYAKVGGVIVGTFSSDETERKVSYGATGKVPDGTPHRGEKGMNGNLVLIPRAVYEKVGPICGAYSHQYGDYDYGWQVRKHGLEYYSSSAFCGVCPQQPERYQHRLREYGLVKRVKLLFDPKGYSLHDAFLYKYRNWGLARAILSVAHVTGKVVLGLR